VIIDAGCTMRDYVLLYVNGRRYALRSSQAFGSLSDFLRSALRLTGTKVVCAEGDCGSCTVLVGRPFGDQIEYRPVTSCIQRIAQLDGTHVVSVEGLLHDGRSNAVQDAMVACHGAQCGYCTPGMVITLSALFDVARRPTRHDVCRALVGNLCRCTGYESILNAAAQVDGAQWQSTSELYPDAGMLVELQRASTESVEIVDGARRLLKPATLAEAVRWRSVEPQAIVLAGGTDLGVAWNKGRREIGTLLCVGSVPELQTCTHTNTTWTIGAATTITAMERTAIEILPPYAAFLERFGSPPIKNAGTLGGNLANGSPIGDTMPALFVLDAQVELIGPRGTRQVNINQFYSGYRQTVLAPDELILRVVVPLPRRDDLFAAYKVSKRRDLDISTITAAVWMRMAGHQIGAARMALGGVAATILRLPRTEAWLSGQEFCASTMRHAGGIAREEISPISDVRGSAEYRMRLVENILPKLFHETSERSAALSGRD
jgi:xanthine dehydrogenase small subunit